MSQDSVHVSKGHSKEERKKPKKEKKRRRQEEADDTLAVSPSPKKKKKKTKRSHENGGTLQAPTSPDAPLGPLVSPFWTETRSYYLPLAPIAQLYPLQGLIAEHLSPMCMTYSHQMKGIVICHENVRLEKEPLEDEDEGAPRALGQCLNEGAACWLWVTADFLVYRPEPGMWVEGYVVAHSEGHLGLLLLNVFNASIEWKRLPKSWQWIATPSHADQAANGDARAENADEMDDDHQTNGDATVNGVIEDEGYWQDGRGRRIERWLRFRVKDWIVSRPGDREKGFFGVEGTLLDEEEEKELQAEEAGGQVQGA